MSIHSDQIYIVDDDGSVCRALSILLGGFITAYNVNCTVVGHCSVWAWLLTLIFIFDTIMITAAHSAEFKKLFKHLKKSVK